MKFGVVVFPGSNCDHDAFYAIGNVLRKPVEFIWHQSENLANCDAIILPGGFSYGDYLRTGAIARFSPVMKSVEKFANSGGMVLGVCNGFQILCEAGLLPGAMMRNSGLRYICRHVHIRVEQTDTPFTNAAQKGQILRIPIAHFDGNYNCDEATLAALVHEEQNRHLDLFRDAPVTLTLARTGDDSCRLLFRQHHAIADGRAFIANDQTGDIFWVAPAGLAPTH